MRVTVTIPVLNGSEYLEGCVGSLKAQKFKDFETVFVVDDRTDDDSLEIIDRLYTGMDYRIVIQTERTGLAGARNIGIDEAEGDIIWFLDVDDHPYPDFLEELVSILDENDADIVFCNHFEYCKRIIPEIPEHDYRVKVLDKEYALSNFIDLPVYSWSRIQKRSLFDDGRARFIQRPAAEDIEQTVRSIAIAKKMCYYEKPLYVYYKSDNTAVKRNRGREIESMEATARSLISFLDESGIPYDDTFKRHLAERIMRQSAFATYREFSRSYKGSYAHELIDGLSERTKEMKVYSLSKTLYYIALYRFTHGKWDGKEGLWKELG